MKCSVYKSVFALFKKAYNSHACYIKTYLYKTLIQPLQRCWTTYEPCSAPDLFFFLSRQEFLNWMLHVKLSRKIADYNQLDAPV